MNKEKTLTLSAMAGIAVLLAAVAAVCMTLALDGAFTPALGYFVKDAPAAAMLYCTFILSVVLGIAAWICFRTTRIRSVPMPGFTKASAGLVLLTLLWRTAETFLQLWQSSASATVVAHKTLMISGAALGILFLLELICELFLPRAQNHPLVALSAFFPPFYIATQLFLLYFDENMATNGSVKILYQLMYVAFMLMYTAQAGLRLGRSKMLPRYLFCLCTATALGGGISASALACFVANIPGHRLTLSQTAFCLAVSLYALTLLLALLRVPRDGWSVTEKPSKQKSITK